MNALKTNIIGRVAGIAFVLVGYWLFGQGLDVLANRPGGAQSDYLVVQAEVVEIVESETRPGSYAPTYVFERPDGERAVCPTNYFPADQPRIGDRETLAVAKAPRPGSCGILFGSAPSVADYLFPGGGLLFMLFGGVLAIFAHEFKAAGRGDGDTGSGPFFGGGGFGGDGGGGDGGGGGD